jgi:pimeloyl-ACP methyl ester carboxylesterase
MATFVLVHGAMHGGWCWRHVRTLLAGRGHDVLTPTLTGQGDRRRSASADIGVLTHVDDVVDTLWFEDLRDVHLVLHSYAGVLAGPVVERSEGRVRSVTYLGAFVAAPGQCLLDVEPPAVAARYRAVAAEHEGRLPAGGQFLDQWGMTDPELRAFVAPRLTDFPARCQSDPVDYDPVPLRALPTTYVRHTDPPLASLDPFHALALAEGWRVEDLATGHDAMLTAPRETADLLERIALDLDVDARSR